MRSKKFGCAGDILRPALFWMACHTRFCLGVTGVMLTKCKRQLLTNQPFQRMTSWTGVWPLSGDSHTKELGTASLQRFTVEMHINKTTVMLRSFLANNFINKYNKYSLSAWPNG